MGAHREKRDRTARMLRIQVLLGQNPGGLTVEEIAKKCSIHPRTIYRDLKALESELNVPIWEEGKKRGIVAGYSLPPIPFSLSEAMNIFIAVRLMHKNSGWYDPNIASAFLKLSSVVPPNIRKQIQNTIAFMEKEPRNPRSLEISEKLAEAWVSQHRVTIRYQDFDEKESAERLIDPYYVEPTAGRSSYVIAYCHLKKEICIFKINRVKSVRVESETYVIPDNFDAVDYLSSAWGIFVDGPVETVKLHFKLPLAEHIMEAYWHHSQVVKLQEDGSLIMILKVNNTIDFRSWVLGWGGEVEVLEPETLRNQIIESHRAGLEVYTAEKNSPVTANSTV